MILGACALSLLIMAMRSWRWLDRNKEQAAWRELVAAAGPAKGEFDPALVRDLLLPAQKYFTYTIAPGTRLLTALEIEMTGEIGFGCLSKPNYRPMSAGQILSPPHGLVWRLNAGPISGSDGITDTTSWTRFWLFGLLPVVRAGANNDHHRSAFGRVVSEGSFWLPSSLLPGEAVTWQEIDQTTARATVRFGAHQQALEITVADDSQPTQVVLQRWSNANPQKTYQEQPFGGRLSHFVEFSGFRLPTRVDGGNWYCHINC